MAEAFLTVENLHEYFNEHKTINGISFEICKGEIYVNEGKLEYNLR